MSPRLTTALLALALIAGVAIGMSLPSAHADKRDPAAAATSLQVVPLDAQREGYGFDIVLVRDGKVYVTRYPSAAEETPIEVKPYALLRER